MHVMLMFSNLTFRILWIRKWIRGSRMTHRSTGDPSPHEPSASPGDRSAAVCQGSQEPPDSQAVHSHCERTAPIASENVFTHEHQ